ncbi:MAG: chitobiase/beta-hexosaminidase C-terminal domain-containing protein [Acidobacteriaceae bacterium]
MLSHLPAWKKNEALCIAGAMAIVILSGCGGASTGSKITLAAKPTFSPAAGTYSSAQMVTISDATPGVTIYYTTDGTIPTTSSAVYSGPVRVATNETVEALAVEPEEIDSALSSANYVIALVAIGPPAVEFCGGPNHILPVGDVHTDLDIHGLSCTVDGSAPEGTYHYRNVNIYGGGSLTFADAKINFHAHSILVENTGGLYAGLNAPAVGPISIWLYGTAQDSAPAITCKSGPTCGIPDAIWNSNPNVPMKTMPSRPCVKASTLDPNSPVGDDCFYQYEVFDAADGPGTYFGKKVLALSYGGSIYLRGAKGIRSENTPIAATPSDSGTSWVRLVDDLKGSESSFHVDRPVPTWGNGDHIVLTTTDYLPGHSEELVIAGVGSDSKGTLITLQNPVKYPHSGTAYDFSSLPASNGPQDDPNRPATQPSRHLETRAAVALLTRSIMIASEGQTPLDEDRTTDHFPAAGFYGGHTLMREGFQNYQVQGVEFYHLGQGGVIGRYPVHFHMDRKVPQPSQSPKYDGTYIVDSSIHDSMTRFITVHATQGLLVARNVGYQSIGHGFYLEDATEINNKLYSNIGIESRAAVDDDLNPRKVPGILSQPGNSGAEVFPFHSDYDHPSIFWITNTWNDFRYNVAVGAGTCGACYWMPPSVNSGPSLYETWDSYASMQTSGRGGATPMLNFVGNSCSTAMNALETVSNTSPCFGVIGADALLPVSPPGQPNNNFLQAIANPNPLPANSYPQVNGDLRQHATLCDDAHQNDCSKVPICTGEGPNEALCAASVIDHFTTSFNWSQKNFAAVWLRGWWYLLRDSAITDVQGGGLTFVSGGGYTRADAAQGFWNLSQRVLFVGNTQPIENGQKVPLNPFASNAGPFNPEGLPCPANSIFCISKADDISMQIDAFGGAQRMISIYDGPSFEDSDAFMDVHITDVGTLSECKSGGNPAGSCNTRWMNAFQSGVMLSPATNNGNNHCILPNAAIAWKQPNGFYYPPAFHSKNLGFENVDIRHFVIQPLWKPKSFQPDIDTVQNTYCTWQPLDFTNFTDVDRQTELSDDDGAITGLVSGTAASYEPSISVTKDAFFNAPLVTDECASGLPGAKATVDTSPYQYVTTALFPDCGGPAGSCTARWASDCGNQQCSGVTLWRQYLTGDELTAYQQDPKTQPSIQMMGQGTGQRSTLTVNHGSYYIDTTKNTGGKTASNDFMSGHSYYVYLLYAKPSTHQNYSIYIGKQLAQPDALASVTPGLVDVTTQAYKFIASSGGDWVMNKAYDAASGVLSLTVDLKNQGPVFEGDRPKFCQPTTYCSIHSDGSCGCKAGSGCNDDSVCAWSNKEIDCPIEGCFGFSVKLPANFPAAGQNLPTPQPALFTSDPYFAVGNVKFYNVDQSTSGAQCHYDQPPLQQ